MEVKSINNVDCANLTVEQATKLLEKEYFVTVLAMQAAPLPEGSLIAVTLVKSSTDSKVGLKLRNIEGKEGLFISEVRDGSLASISMLRPGMLFSKINNVDCTNMSYTEAAKLMAEAEGPLTFLVYTPHNGADSVSYGFSKYTTATVDVDAASEKEETTKVGLELKQDECGKVMIDRVDPKGPFFDTPLRAGMELLQVNAAECTSCEQAMELLKAGGKPLTVLACKYDNRFVPGTLVSGVLVKETKDAKLGIRFGMSRDAPVVSNTKDGSPASMTDLDVGMIVHSINNNLCFCMTPPEITQILVEAEGTITILAEVPQRETQDPTRDAVSFVTATMHKEGDGKVGMKFGGRDSGIIITEIAEGSLAASTELRVGMEVLSINNADLANEKVTTAASLLAGAQGYLTVVAKRPSLPAGALVTGAMKRESADVKWGAKLGFRGKSLVIKGIYADSPAASTDLEPGMLVRSINNVDASTIKASDIAEIFAAESRTMTILAETTRDTNMVCPTHIMSVRSIRGLLHAPEPVEPELDEPEESEDPEDDESNMSEEGEVLDAETEIKRLRAMNAALKAKLANKDAPAEPKRSSHAIKGVKATPRVPAAKPMKGKLYENGPHSTRK